MSYSTVYKGSFVNIETDISNANNQKQVDIYIFDTESGVTDSPNMVIDLEMTGEPLRFINVNNGEDKFEVIRSRRTEIKVYSSDVIDIETFALGGPYRWYVEIYYDFEIKFKGWLSLADLSQDFQPNPVEITLIATDGLNFLDAEELRDFDDEIPQNEHDIMSYIMWSLGKTNLTLDIWCVFNIREQFATPLISDDSGDGHFFKWAYLDAKTFEQSLSKYDSCKLVLEKILKKQAYITQHNGHWLIVRVDELVSTLPFYCFKFDSGGVFIEQAQIDLDKSIGEDQLLSWMNDDAVKSLAQPVKSDKLVFNYQYPSEIPCNRDFSRGTGADPTGVASETIEYTLDCWDFLREGTTPAGLDSAPFAGSTGVLRKLFEFGYEKERYIAITTAGGFRHYFKSSPIYLKEGDKLELGYDFRLSTSETITNISTAHVRLVGTDGFVYDWDYDEATGISFWNQKTTSATIFDNEFRTDWSGANTLDWHQLTATSQPLPVDGTVYIRLMNGNAVYELQFSNLTLNIISFINGSYQKYTGQYFKITQPTSPEKYKEEIEDEVFMSDGPRRMIKGVLLKADGADFVTGAIYYTANVFPNADYPDSTYLHPYGYIQVYDLWNQNSRVMRKFEGNVDHLGATADILDIPAKITLTDANLSTNGKTFMALHMDQDVHSVETSIFLHEVFDENIPKEYPASEFKYITQ